MTAIIAQVVQHTRAHRQSAEGQRRTLWRWVSILPRESCRQFVHKRHNQPLIRQSLAFESPSTFPWIVSICPWNLVKGLRHPQVPPKKTNERQNIRLTRFVFPERDRSASKLLQSWLQSPHLSINVKTLLRALYSFSLGSAMMSNNLVFTTCIGHCIKRATEKIQSIKVHLACCRALRRLQWLWKLINVTNEHWIDVNFQEILTQVFSSSSQRWSLWPLLRPPDDEM